MLQSKKIKMILKIQSEIKKIPPFCKLFKKHVIFLKVLADQKTEKLKTRIIHGLKLILNIFQINIHKTLFSFIVDKKMILKETLN